MSVRSVVSALVTLVVAATTAVAIASPAQAVKRDWGPIDGFEQGFRQGTAHGTALWKQRRAMVNVRYRDTNDDDFPVFVTAAFQKRVSYSCGQGQSTCWRWADQFVRRTQPTDSQRFTRERLRGVPSSGGWRVRMKVCERENGSNDCMGRWTAWKQVHYR